jgi:hypothetical protein
MRQLMIDGEYFYNFGLYNSVLPISIEMKYAFDTYDTYDTWIRMYIGLTNSK